jgi:hypothetical protein
MLGSLITIFIGSRCWDTLEKYRNHSDRLVLRGKKGTKMVPVFILVETNEIPWLVWP